MADPIISRPPYRRRNVPVLSALVNWLATELGNIQRAMKPSRVRICTTDDAPTNQDETVLYDATNNAITVSLPLPAQVSGLTLTLKRLDATGHTVTLGAVVDGVTGPTLASQYSSKTIQSDGFRWLLLAQV